jgi:hypothetical protein
MAFIWACIPMLAAAEVSPRFLSANPRKSSDHIDFVSKRVVIPAKTGIQFK